MTETTLDFRAIFDALPASSAVLNASLTFQACNAAYEVISGRERAALIGRNIFDVFPAFSNKQARQLRASFKRVLRTKRPHHIAELRYDIRASEHSRYEERVWSISNVPVISPAGDVTTILHYILDITHLSITSSSVGVSKTAPTSIGDEVQIVRGAQTILAIERARLHNLFRQAPGFICVLDGPEYIFDMANDAYYQLVNHREIIGRKLAEVLPEVVSQGYLERLNSVYQSGQPYIGRALSLEIHPVAGGPPQQKYIDLVYQPIFDDDQNIIAIFVQGNDVTDAHNLSREVAFQADHDPLTGLLNRRGFSNAMEKIGDAELNALLYMDIDHFKIVNDRCGHMAGDLLLKAVAATIESIAGDDALLGRLGGDEFGLIIPQCSAETAIETANRIRRAVKSLRFTWKEKIHSVSMSFGVATFSDFTNTSLDSAMELADAACFLAKEDGRNRVKFAHTADDDVNAQLRDMDNVARLKDAIRNDQIVLFGQEIISLEGIEDSRTRFFEVLARLCTDDGTLIPPTGFIPAAERFGTIEELDRHIVVKVFAHLNELEENIRASVCYFTNLSAITLANRSFPKFISALKSKYTNVAPSRICFEVTETAAISDVKRTAESMATLQEEGFSFALDDFGSGMATFAYLRHLPVRFVKIDGEFIKGMADDQASRIIVESVAKLASSLGMQTIAESVESSDLLADLRSVGVHFGQGFGLHKPELLAAAVLRGSRQ